MSLPFDPALIDARPKQMTAQHVLQKIARGSIWLQPDFQRNIVWDDVRKSRLIESLLLKIPLPAFYLDAAQEDRWQVIDGLQRLSTLDAFVNQQSLTLQGLEYLVDLEGKKFGELSQLEQDRIEETELTLIMLYPQTPKKVKYTIFRRVNTGGLALTNQEIRYALYEGPVRNFLSDLAQSEEFLLATNGIVDSMRMEDRECVLRFLAFRLNPYDPALPSEASITFDDLLNQTMDDLNQSTPVMREQYAEDFRASMRKAHILFEDLAFREIQDQLETGPFRKALFEVWSTLLCAYSLEAVQPGLIKDAVVRASIAAMTNDAAFLAAIQPGANDRQSIVTRFSTVDKLLRQILD